MRENGHARCSLFSVITMPLSSFHVSGRIPQRLKNSSDKSPIRYGNWELP